MKLLITKIEDRLDKNDKAYKHIRVQSPTEVNGVKIEAKESAFNAMEENYLGNKEFGWDLKEGDYMEGEFATAKVEDYTIDGRTVSTATVLARPLPGQFKVNEIAIKRAFANAGHVLASEGSSEEVAAEATELQA